MRGFRSSFAPALAVFGCVLSWGAPAVQAQHEWSASSGSHREILAYDARTSPYQYDLNNAVKRQKLVRRQQLVGPWIGWERPGPRRRHEVRFLRPSRSKGPIRYGEVVAIHMKPGKWLQNRVGGYLVYSARSRGMTLAIVPKTPVHEWRLTGGPPGTPVRAGAAFGLLNTTCNLYLVYDDKPVGAKVGWVIPPVRETRPKPKPEPAPPAPVARAAFALADKPTADEYAPEFAGNPAGGPIKIKRQEKGAYEVHFDRLRAPDGASVQVSACGSEGERASIRSWGAKGDGFAANVMTFDAKGARADASFTVHVDSPATLSGTAGFALAARPEAAKYSPDKKDAHNSSGGDITITRRRTGCYKVRFSGLGQAGGNVQVTSYGGAGYGKAHSWGIDEKDLVVQVRCFAPGGAPADLAFVVGLLFPGAVAGGHGYAANSQPTPEPKIYSPPASSCHNSGGGPITIQHVSTGVYRVRFARALASIPADRRRGGSVQVTAFGSSSDYCTVAQWGPDGDDLAAEVRGFDSNGRPKDTYFTLVAFW